MFVPKGDFGNEGKDSFSTNNFINDYQWQWEKMFRLDSGLKSAGMTDVLGVLEDKQKTRHISMTC